jgi:ubiquitin C-terminal hydrolase
VSRTLEEFYTVRCQVADMRNLYESLDEVTVKDTLEGDNMYTCSQCGKKVRAEKRFVILLELYISPWLYVVSVPLLISCVIFSKPP